MSSTDILTYPPVKNKLYNKPCLFALMSILSYSLLTLVGSHLMAFSFFSAWHSYKFILYVIIIWIFLYRLP